jgi:hypothetical protein
MRSFLLPSFPALVWKDKRAAERALMRNETSVSSAYNSTPASNVEYSSLSPSSSSESNSPIKELLLLLLLLLLAPLFPLVLARLVLTRPPVGQRGAVPVE